MINQSDSDLRKSKRQRTPNSFYTQAIAELKRAPPKTTKQTNNKGQNKKQPIFHQSEQNSQVEQQIEQTNNNRVMEGNVEWYTCRMPRTGQLLKVQFVYDRPDEPIVEKKKEQVKITKKMDSSFDLLSLFQQAIKNVNEQPVENEPLIKQPSIKTQRSTRPAKRQDVQGSITNVHIGEGSITFLQSVLGQISVQIQSDEMTKQQELDLNYIEQLRQKILNTHVLGQVAVFSSE